MKCYGRGSVYTAYSTVYFTVASSFSMFTKPKTCTCRLQSQYMNVYRILTETPFEVKNFSQEQQEKQFIVHNC